MCSYPHDLYPKKIKGQNTDTRLIKQSFLLQATMMDVDATYA